MNKPLRLAQILALAIALTDLLTGCQKTPDASSPVTDSQTASVSQTENEDILTIDPGNRTDFTARYEEIRLDGLESRIGSRWSVGAFLDDDNLLIGSFGDSINRYYRYDFRKDKLTMLFEDTAALPEFPHLTIESPSDFRFLIDNKVLYEIRQDQLVEKTTLPDKGSYYSALPSLAAKQFLCTDVEGNFFITDLLFQNPQRVPVDKKYYQAAWLDEETILLAGRTGEAEPRLVAYHLSTNRQKEIPMPGAMLSQPFLDSPDYFGFRYIQNDSGNDRLGVLRKYNNTVSKFWIRGVSEYYRPTLQGRFIAYFTAEDQFLLYDIPSGQNLLIAEKASGFEAAALVSPDGKTVILTTDKRRIYTTTAILP